MKHNRLFKIVLTGLLLISLVAISLNLLNRLRKRPEIPSVEPLTDDTSQRITEVEFSNYKSGNVEFQIKSSESTLNENGIQNLRDVDLKIFRPPDRVQADQVQAETARYDSENKLVEFQKNVKITLNDRTVISADQAFADLNKHSVSILEKFAISTGKAEGEGKRLLYDTQKNLLRIKKGLILRIPTDIGNLEITSDEMIYRPQEGYIFMSGKCRIDTVQRSLLSEQIHLWLDEKQKFERAVALGGVVFNNKESLIKGENLTAWLSANNGHLINFTLASSKPNDPAVYQGGGGTGPMLRAYDIKGVFTHDNNLGKLEFQVIKAVDLVEIKHLNAGIKSGRSDHLTHVTQTDSSYETLDLSGNVELIREQSGSRQTIQGDQLVLNLSSGANLDGFQVLGESSVSRELAGLQSVVTAKEKITASFENGQIKRLETEGLSKLLDENNGRKSSIEASQFISEYENGRPLFLTANGPVSLEFGRGKSLFQGRSKKLMMHYNKEGVLERTELFGSIELFNKSDKERIVLSSGRGLIRNSARNIELFGAPLPQIRTFTTLDRIQSTTTASRIHLNVERGGIETYGPTETILEGENPLILKAGKMEVDSGYQWINYSLKPRMKLSESSIKSSSMRLNLHRDQLIADGDIRASVTLKETVTPSQYNIISDRLTLNRSSSEAIFKGNVKATTKDLDIESNEMTLHFLTPSLTNLQRIVAEDRVILDKGDRSALGEKVIYVPSDGTVIVTGEKAQVTDSKNGRAFGSKLTFNLADDSLLIE